jgi:hypothetical protein
MPELNLAATSLVLSEVLAERKRQHALWGQQDLPIGNTRHYAMLEKTAKEMCERHEKSGDLTFFDIVNEEFWEAFASDDLITARAEFVHFIAAGVQAVERIDREMALKNKTEVLP